MADNQQTLENLLVDEEEISEEILHNLLREYIQGTVSRDPGKTKGRNRTVISTSKKQARYG